MAEGKKEFRYIVFKIQVGWHSLSTYST